MKTQKKNRFIFLAITSLLLMGCASLKSKSIFTSDNIKLGITKTEIIDKYGKPYKESFSYDDNKVLQEELCYKEELYIKGWYVINTVFHFENSRLVSQKQEERAFGKDCSCEH